MQEVRTLRPSKEECEFLLSMAMKMAALDPPPAPFTQWEEWASIEVEAHSLPQYDEMSNVQSRIAVAKEAAAKEKVATPKAKKKVSDKKVAAKKKAVVKNTRRNPYVRSI